jgi:hypothetical protein
MQKQKIADWLNSKEQDWPAGIALLSAFSTKRHLIRVLLIKGPSSRTRFKLRYELSQIMKTEKPAALAKPVKPFKHTPKPTNPTISAKVLQAPGELTGDPYLDNLYAKKNKCHREAMSLKNSLEYFAKPQRKENAERILELIAERNLLWRQIDYYEKFKIKPPDVLSSTDPALLDLKQKRDNLRTSVSKLKKLIADPTKAKSKDLYEARMALKLLEISELDRQINF